MAEYEGRIRALESLLQERNAAQPHIGRQPLLVNDTQPSVPIATWVDSLRQEVQTMPHPRAPRIDPFALEPVPEVDPVVSDENVLDSNEIEDRAADWLISRLSLPLGISELDDPLTTMESEVNPVLSTNCTPDLGVPTIANTGASPSLVDGCAHGWPPPPAAKCKCDWYLPPPDMATSLLAEYLTDFNTAVPLYQPQAIVEHLRVCYAGESDESSVAWTSAYVVFGLAHM